MMREDLNNNIISLDISLTSSESTQNAHFDRGLETMSASRLLCCGSWAPKLLTQTTARGLFIPSLAKSAQLRMGGKLLVQAIRRSGTDAAIKNKDNKAMAKSGEASPQFESPSFT